MSGEYTLEPLTYYKWKWQKFRADRRVQRMDYICKGIYRELLDECWVKGYVLSNLEDLAEIVGCEEEVIDKYWHMLSKCLVLLDNGKRLHSLARDRYDEEGNHKLVSSSLNEERTAKDQQRIRKSISGALGGKAKNNNISNLQQISEATASKCLANESECHIEEKRREEKSKDTLVNPTDKPKAKNEIRLASYRKGFDQWWNLYDKKRHKSEALKYWMKLSEDEMKKAVAVVGDYTKANEKKYRTDPHRYLRDKAFEYEIILDVVNNNFGKPITPSTSMPNDKYRKVWGEPFRKLTEKEMKELPAG